MYTRMEAFQGMHVRPAKRDAKKSLTAKKCDYPTDKETDIRTNRGWTKLSLPKQHKKVFDTSCV